MKFLDRVDKIKKEKVMKRGIVAVAVAVGLMVFGGCASMVYFSSEGHVPDEAPSVSAVSIDDSIMSVDQPCFAATSMDFTGLGYLGEKGGPLALLLWSPFFVVDIPISLCTDIVTMPWQISRYRHIHGMDDSEARSAMVPELLRGLKDSQSESGYFYQDSDNKLASTALASLAFLAHGDMTYTKGEFGETCKKAVDYIVSCTETTGETIRFKGEEMSPQAFFIAADAIVTAYGLTHDPKLRDLAEKSVARTINEVSDMEAASVVAAKFDKAIAAAKLRWAVVTLQSAKDAGLAAADLDSMLADAKSVLAGCGESDNGYYDVWKLYRRVWIEGPTGEEDYKEWAALLKEKKAALRKSMCVVGAVKDSEGKWRWKSRTRPCSGGIWASGLGNVSDTALAILQVTWPVSHKLPPENGYKDDAKKGEAPPVEVEI